GARATACSPRARSGRCTTSPTSWAASCWSYAPAGPAGMTCSAPCCARSAGRGPVNVVVVEDIHWADEATMDLLRFVGRRLRDARVLLVATFRDDDLAMDDQLRVVHGQAPNDPADRPGTAVRG